MSEEFKDVVFYKVDVDENDVSLYIREPSYIAAVGLRIQGFVWGWGRGGASSYLL